MIADTVQEIIKRYAGPAYSWKVGDVIRHPRGYTIRLTGGCYLSDGRVSNFWDWVVLDAKGNETRRKGSGYGWNATPIA